MRHKRNHWNTKWVADDIDESNRRNKRKLEKLAMMITNEINKRLQEDTK
jgi:hypothetical protein